MPRNPVVRDQIANPKRNAGRHQDRRQVRRQEPIEESVHATICDECGCAAERVISCPDGAEICQECFDQGGH